MATVEFLYVKRPNMRAMRMLDALWSAVELAGDVPKKTTWYLGKSDWLIFQGSGFPEHNQARNLQRKRGHTFHTDLGYTNREENMMRVCVDDDHPHKWFYKTEQRPSNIQLRNTFKEDGPIILVGLGTKSRKYLRAFDWEKQKFKQLKAEFPDRQIIYRPKGDDFSNFPCKTDSLTPFSELVDGASLVVARHSNCCIDAMLANVPFSCEDGAAMAFDGDRQKFVNKLSRWQYTPDRASEAWAFAKEIVK